MAAGCGLAKSRTLDGEGEQDTCLKAPKGFKGRMTVMLQVTWPVSMVPTALYIDLSVGGQGWQSDSGDKGGRSLDLAPDSAEEI